MQNNDSIKNTPFHKNLETTETSLPGYWQLEWPKHCLHHAHSEGELSKLNVYCGPTQNKQQLIVLVNRTTPKNSTEAVKYIRKRVKKGICTLLSLVGQSHLQGERPGTLLIIDLFSLPEMTNQNVEFLSCDWWHPHTVPQGWKDQACIPTTAPPGPPFYPREETAVEFTVYILL